MSTGDDTSFAGSIPKLYDELLVPLFFEPYADDLAARLMTRQPARVLEIAAGTGVVTRRLSRALPDASITATDLNQAMLDHATSIGTDGRVEWRQADAMQLPFGDASFDAVVCQFGAMFFPDRPAAYAEARRVLAPDGVFLFNSWDAIEHNELSDVATTALCDLYPDDPPRFLARTPHGYHDTHLIARDVEEAGFSRADIVTVAFRTTAPSAHVAAVAICEGTPLRNELGPRLDQATAAAAAAIDQRFGPGAVEGKIQAHIVTALR